MTSTIVKRSIVIDGKKTSLGLEDAFWLRLKEIARAEGLTLSSAVAAIKEARPSGNLSSAIRVFVLDYFCGALANGHDRVLLSRRLSAALSEEEVATKRTVIVNSIERFRRLLSHASDEADRRLINNHISAEEIKLTALLVGKNALRGRPNAPFNSRFSSHTSERLAIFGPPRAGDTSER